MNQVPDLQSAVQLLAWPWPSADPVPDISTAEHLHPSAENHKHNTLAVKSMHRDSSMPFSRVVGCVCLWSALTGSKLDVAKVRPKVDNCSATGAFCWWDSTGDLCGHSDHIVCKAKRIQQPGGSAGRIDDHNSAVLTDDC